MKEEINSFTTRIKEYSEDFLTSVSLNLLEFQIYGNKVLEELLRKLRRYRSSNSSDQLYSLEGRIREAACKLEDVLESEFFRQSLTSNPSSLLSLDLHEVNVDIDAFTQSLKKLKKYYLNELFDGCTEDADADDAVDVTSKIDTKMIGFSDELLKIRDDLTTSDSSLIVITVLTGMAGIGKTTLATKLFKDPLIKSWFDHHMWVDVGSTFQLEKTRQYILANMKLDRTHELKGKRYLVMLDDVWEKQISSFLEKLLPVYDDVVIRVLLTTRLIPSACLGRFDAYIFHEMPFMDKGESWELLRDTVFGDQEYYGCPLQLEKAGKKIAENCEGLPLTIITVANLLSRAEKTPECWNKLANKENRIFIEAYDQMSKVLRPSYTYLPKYTEACFLYMGVFPQNYEITRAKLNNLWIAEGFPCQPEDFDTIIHQLFSSSLLVTRQRRFDNGNKTFSLHSSFWYLCKREASKNKFSHVLKSKADGLSHDLKRQRRLCVHNNTLFCIKDVHKSMESISTAHSLLCSGPPHPYPVPLCFGLELLRVLDALSIRFYEFPMEAVKLVLLRYFALTYNGDLPCSISKLRNLEFLIIRQHTSINSSSRSYLPIEIWDMKKLKHLQIMGSDLTDPRGARLPNLVTLLDVGPRSCTRSILEGLPNLTKLGIRIELTPDHGADQPASRCFDHISNLDKLESLKCVVVNPELRFGQVVCSGSAFPESLKKLSLSGSGYPWDYMKSIASLPYLEVLKLRCYAFCGPKWATGEQAFPTLQFLLMEDTDLVQWACTGVECFPELVALSLKHCYKLRDIPRELGENFLTRIEMVGCNPSAVTCANNIATESVTIEVVDHQLGL